MEKQNKHLFEKNGLMFCKKCGALVTRTETEEGKFIDLCACPIAEV